MMRRSSFVVAWIDAGEKKKKKKLRSIGVDGCMGWVWFPAAAAHACMHACSQ
jgi:hypothetical protein